jgi:hypothetical protein
MNERHLRRLLNRIVALSAPLPFAIIGVACGGAATIDSAGVGGSAAAGGKNTDGGAASAASGGSHAGGGEVGGSSSGGYGAGGSFAGYGGSDTSGAGGDSACAPPSTIVCGSGSVTVPRTCIDSAMAIPGTALPSATCMQICRGFSCSVGAVNASSVTLDCVVLCGTGRRPVGLRQPSVSATQGLGRYFAEVSRLEAASVEAFRILRDELRAHRAPRKLIAAAARAARDEIRHTRATGALARRFGARAGSAEVDRIAPRSIEAMALENAVEGCVRETYGALLATWQARVARDPVVRAAMRRIARDETRHAALSWRVGRWLETRLDSEARRRVERAKQAEARLILRSAENDGTAPFAAVAGLPTQGEALQLANEMTRTLWS